MNDVADSEPFPITISTWSKMGAETRTSLRPALEAICLEAATRTEFATDADRDAFLRLWLGHYLEMSPTLAFVAFAKADAEQREPASSDRPIGYCVATDRDARSDLVFDDLTYFDAMAPQLSAYPAHLHINVAADGRGRGVGARLIGRAVQGLSERRCLGVHVVTGEGARNVGFYLDNGFTPAAGLPWQGRKLIVLGRRLLRDDGS